MGWLRDVFRGDDDERRPRDVEWRRDERDARSWDDDRWRAGRDDDRNDDRWRAGRDDGYEEERRFRDRDWDERPRAEWEEERRRREMDERAGWSNPGYMSPGYMTAAYGAPGAGPGYGWGVAQPWSENAGRGPRSYRRSDERIREDVNDRLTDHPGIDATNVEVEVRDGDVILRGTVASRTEKRLAEDVAAMVRGVQDVGNHLRVRHEAGRWVGQPGPMDRERMSRQRAFEERGGGMEDLPGRLRLDMEVVSLEGERLGRVKEITRGQFLLDRPRKRDLYVPYHAVREIRGDYVVLGLREDEVDRTRWESPPVFERSGAEAL